MKTVLTTHVVLARKQFPMESFASHSVRKQQILTVKKKNPTNSINSTRIQIMPLKIVKKHISGDRKSRNRLIT